MTPWPSTVFSDCGTYRYTLFRPAALLETYRPPLLGCWLNPSTASTTKNDPTTHRVLKFAAANAFGAYIAINPFAFRSPHPKIMLAAGKPIGVENDYWILRAVAWCRRQSGTIVIGWGNDGTHLGRDKEVLKLLGRPLYCFGLTQAGNPHFPTPFIQPYNLRRFDP